MKKRTISLVLALAMTFGLSAGTVYASETEAAVDTVILKEADDNMLNTYTAIAVNPEAPFVLPRRSWSPRHISHIRIRKVFFESPKGCPHNNGFRIPDIL